MAVSPTYLAFVVELLEPFAQITTRKLFGGVGIYGDGLFFALIADNVLYFKVDDTNRSRYLDAGMQPFRPFDDDRSMNYFPVPAEVLEDPDQLQDWMQQSIEVARSSKQKKRS